MPETHDLGSFFLTYTTYPDYQKAPLVGLAVAYETEHPYRHGKAVSLRLWPSRVGLMLGRWHPNPNLTTEDDALSSAMGSHVLGDVTVEEIAEWDGSRASEMNEHWVVLSDESSSSLTTN